MSVRFEWDIQKAKINQRRHKVSFEEACTVFSDPLGRIFDDESHSTPNEQREIIIGHSQKQHVLLVCFTELRPNVIRIISAREATSREQQDYEENIHF